MTSSLTDIRTALGNVLAPLGLQVYTTFTDVANTPAVVIDMANNPTIEYTGAMHMGGDCYHFDLFILVANTDTKNAQVVLDQYITGQGPKSIRQALFQNSDLDLADVDAMAEGVRGYGGSPGAIAGIKMIGAIMRVCVTVT
jgi:hypothetical protein